MREFVLAVLLALAVTQTVAIPQCPPIGGEDGDILLGNPADCTTYYMCLNGVAILMPCSPGLHWSDALKRCEYPEVAQCEETEEKPSSTTVDPTTSGPTISTTKRPVPDKCPAENGPEDVLLPNPADCGSFFKCLDGVPHLIKCPSGQHWSIDLNRCDYPEIAHCVETETSQATEPSTSGTTKVPPVRPDKCPAENGPEDVLLPNPADCGSFFKCLDGVPHLIKCPPGQQWSIEYNRCDYPEIAKCVETETSEAPKPTTSKPPSDKPTECPAENGPEDVLLPNPEDCGSFFKCLNGIPHLILCPAGQEWSTELSRCDFPEIAKCEHKNKKWYQDSECLVGNNGFDILLPNPEDCSTYFQCSNGVKILKKCPLGTLWDVVMFRCDHEAYARCA